MHRDRISGGAATALFLPFLIAGCGSSNSASLIPALTPIVKSATPAGFGGSASTVGVLEWKKFHSGAPAISTSRSNIWPGLSTGSLETTDIRSRFFGGSSGQGPTQIFNLLPQIDERLAELTVGTTCLSGTPVAYTIKPAGAASPITMYAQCYRTVSGGGGAGPFTNTAGVQDPQFFMIGQDTSGTYYLYVAIGAEWLAAKETPLVAGSTSNYAVHLWMGVGYGNGASGSNDGQCGTSGEWDACSYGVLEMVANAQVISGAVSSIANFEFTASGTGFGYCGIQAISDGANIFLAGSADMGSSCTNLETLCFSATSTSTTTDTSATPSCPTGATCLNGCTAAPACSTSDATAGRCLIANTSSGFGLTPIGRIANGSVPNTGVISSLGASTYPGAAGALYSGSPANNVTLNGTSTSTDSLYFSSGPAVPGNASFSSATAPITAAWAAAAGVTSF